MARFTEAALLALVLALPASAAGWEELRDRRPDLFHDETGFRIARYRAPTPDDVPGAIRVDAAGAKRLLGDGAIALDVGAARQSRFDELDGTWLVGKAHLSLPGAVWLPETGRGTLSPVMARYLSTNLARLTGGDPARPILVFCIADCWMSWNAARRIRALGYSGVHWFAEGTDGWRDAGLPLVPVTPVPVDTD